MGGSPDEKLRISYVAFQPHVVITYPEALGRCLVLRIPEYVRDPKTGKGECPGDVVWYVLEPDTRLSYHWGASDEVKERFGIDFRGEVESGEGEVSFRVTMVRPGEKANPNGVSLFCLQAGGAYPFHDYEGQRTFVRQGDRWRSVHDMIDGAFPSHRMCTFRLTEGKAGDGETTAKLMAKTSGGGDMVLGIALDAGTTLSCNHQLWPSCIHSNPGWGDLGPGGEETIQGKVYCFRGALEDIWARYEADFGQR